MRNDAWNRSAWNRRSVLKAGLASTLAPPFAATPSSAETASRSAVLALDPLPMTGVNLAGAEFGDGSPGVVGQDYIYPPLEMVDAYADLGFTAIRLPFRWERLQPSVFGPFDETEWAAIETLTRHATARGLYVALDVHNYAKRGVVEKDYQPKLLIGSPEVPSEAFATFWSTIANRTKDDEKILYGLMNEPTDIRALDWLPIVNEAIAKIREVGAKNLILVPGVAWTGAHSWYEYFNTIMQGVEDPDGALAIEVHQYLDDDSSGRSADSVSSTIGSARIEAFQEWARARGFKAFLGEFGAGPDPVSVAALEDMATEMAASPDVWLGWTAWAGGPWWGDDYPLRLERDQSGAWPEQTLALRRFATKSLHTDRRTAGSAIDVDFARDRARGVESPSAAVVSRRGAAEAALQRDGRLRTFRGDAPKITDYGLRIDGAGENLFDVFKLEAASVLAGAMPRDVKTPKGDVGAYGLGEWMRDIELSSIRRLEEDAFATFAIHVHADPRVGLELVGNFDGEVAVFDLGRMHAHSVSGGAWASMSEMGEWRRLEVAWRARSRPSIRLKVRRPQRPERWNGASGEASTVAFWGASLEQAGVSAPFRHAERAADEIALARPFQDLLQSGETTLLVETRSLTPFPTALPILSLGDTLLLERSAEGALSTEIGRGGGTGRRPLWVWSRRHRSAIAISRRGRTATIATTGEPAQAVSLAERDVSDAALAAPLRLGAFDARALNGSVTRLVAFAEALEPEALADLVA